MKYSPSDYLYNVPCKCGKKLPVRITQAGDTVRCECGEEILVPSRQKIQCLECFIPKKKEPSDKGTGWTVRRRRIFVGCVICCTSLALFAICRSRQPRMIDVKNAPIETTWVYWQQLRQGLDRYTPSGERTFVERTNQARISQAILLTFAGLGFLLAIVSFVRHDPGHRMKRKRSTEVVHRLSP